MIDLINIFKKLEHIEDEYGNKIDDNEIEIKINKKVEFNLFLSRN